MTAPLTIFPPRRSRASGGFKLVELVAVMIVTGILAATAIPALDSLAGSRHAAAARDLARGLTQARQRALATGVRTWVVIDVDAETWSMLNEDPLNPGRSDALAAIDPATGMPLVVQFGAGALAQTYITSADFDGATELGFDWMGRPLNATETSLLVQGVIETGGSHVVYVEPDTGYVTHVAP